MAEATAHEASGGRLLRRERVAGAASGSPAASGSARRSRRVNLAFTEPEYALLRAAAEPMAPGAWASEQVLQVARGVVVPVPTGEREALRLLAEARVAVNRIGTNLNQLVAAANAAVVAGDDPAGAVSGEQLAAVLARVQATLQRVDAATVAVMGR